MFESEFEESIIDDTLQKHKDLLKVLSMHSRILYHTFSGLMIWRTVSRNLPPISGNAATRAARI